MSGTNDLPEMRITYEYEFNDNFGTLEGTSNILMSFVPEVSRAPRFLCFFSLLVFVNHLAAILSLQAHAQYSRTIYRRSTWRRICSALEAGSEDAVV